MLASLTSIDRVMATPAITTGAVFNSRPFSSSEPKLGLTNVPVELTKSVPTASASPPS